MHRHLFFDMHSEMGVYCILLQRFSWSKQFNVCFREDVAQKIRFETLSHSVKLNMLSVAFYVTCSDVLKEDSEDDGDEDDEGSDDDDGDTDEDKKHASRPPSQSGPRVYTVLSEFKGEQEGDLSVQVTLQGTELKHWQASCMSATHRDESVKTEQS